MATFGPVTSPFANVLYNPMAVDQAVQGRQRNQLMMDNARQDQAYQNLDRDRQEVARASASLLSLPEDQRPAAYTAAVRQLQSQGFARQAPPQYPGHQQIEALARQGMTATEQFKLAEQRRLNDGWAAMLGGNVPQASGAAPTSAPAMPSGTAPAVPANLAPLISQASQDTNIPAPLLTALFQQESQLGRDPNAVSNGGGIAQIIRSTAANPGYGMPPISDADRLDPNKAIPWAARYLAARNPGVDWNDPTQRDNALRRYNGGGDPNYAQNVTRHLPAAQPQPTPPGGPAARTGGTDMAGPGVPAAPALVLNSMGLTDQQMAQLRLMGPEQGRAAMLQMQNQNQTRLEQQRDNALAERRFAATQAQQAETLTLQRDAAKRAQEAADRAARLEERKIEQAANPGPSAADRTKLKTIETEADGILGALEAYRTARTNASAPSRIASAVGLPTELNSTYGNAALLAKGEALYNLGVLNGPDLGIIRRVLADPGTVTGGMAGQATVDAQIDQVKNLLQQRLATARSQYGGQPAARPDQPRSGLMDGAEPPPPGRSATAPAAPRGGPQVGAIEDGYRFRGGDPSKPESWERAQ